LKGGISIEHLKVGSFHVSGLYLKLDKKFVLRADRVLIPQRTEKRELPDPKKTLERTKKILRYFQSIALKEIVFENNSYSIYYADRILYMTNDEYEVAATDVNRTGDSYHAQIELFYLKKYDIRLSGTLSYNEKTGDLKARGEASYRDIRLEFAVDKRGRRILYVMRSNRFRELRPLLEQFPIRPKIKAWIVDRSKAERYRLVELKGIYDLDSRDIRTQIGRIQAEAKLEGVSVRFRDGIPPATAEEVTVRMKEGTLLFLPKNPIYEGRHGEGTKVSIVDLDNPKPVRVIVDLKLDTPMDSEVHRVLEAYKIKKIPIYQESGESFSHLLIEFYPEGNRH